MKQHLTRGRPSDRAVRMANDIYFTYLYTDDALLSIPFTRLCEVFGEHDLTKIKCIIEEVFEELNEPILLTDCSIKGKHIAWEIVHYFEFEYRLEAGNAYVDLEVNMLYLDALETFDIEPYINFQ